MSLGMNVVPLGGAGGLDPGGGGGAPVDPAAQLKTLTGHLNLLSDPNQKDEAKLKSAQELSDNFDLILASPNYATFLDHAMRVFLKLLRVRIKRGKKKTYPIHFTKIF